MKHLPLFACFLFLVPILLFAQTPVDTTKADPEKEMEKTLEERTQDAEDSQLVDILTALLENPLDLNTATVEELTQIPGVTPIIGFNIVRAREAQPFKAVGELLRVEGMTEELFLRVRQFVSVKQRSAAKSEFPLASFKFRTRSSRDLQDRKGFLDGTYRGSAIKLYNRLTARTQTFGQSSSYSELGILTEKDAGEESYANFLAGYAQLNLVDYSTRIILGDFTVEAAEGLVFWRSIGFSKGSEVISTLKKSGIGIRPYLSTDENWYYRGFAAQVDFGIATVSGMYSNKPLHASVSLEGVITSFNSDGQFRTESELQRKSSAHTQLLGGRFTLSPMQGLTFGGSGYRATFDHEVSQSGTYGFHGQSAAMVGLDFSFIQSNFTVFSEVARSHTQAIAGVGGIMSEPTKGVEIAIVGRSYPKDFVSLYGFGFGESSSTQNESGIYVAGRARITRWLTISSYFDQFVFPWRVGSLKLPSGGNDFLFYSELQLSDRVSLQLQYKHKNKAINEASADAYNREFDLLGERQQTNYRVTLEFHSSIALRLRSRIEAVNVDYLYSPQTEHGLLAYQDIRIYPLPKLLLDARVIAFESDSFDSRIYEFESDLRGTFSNPALFGKGIRWYLVARYELGKSVDVWLKYSQTVKDGVKVMSSGSSLIQGDLDNRISLQVDIVY